MEGSRLVAWLPLIPLLPFLGFVLNGLFGKRAGRGFVSFVGIGTPAVAFALALAAFCALLYADRGTVVLVRGTQRASVYSALGQKGIPFVPQTADDERDGIVRVEGSIDAVSAALSDMKPPPIVERAGDFQPRSWYGPAMHDARGAARDVPWISAAGFEVVFRLVFDRLSGVLVLVVLGVGSLIHVYSIGYMASEDRGGFARYFSYLNFFVAMMLVLVLAGDLLLMFVGWEGVGLASYLLIGFEYREGWKAEAGIKAFVVNRIGDLGFILGVIALATAAMAQGHGDLRIDHLNDLALHGKIPAFTLGAAAVCLFVGATGKSAQLPLFVWLPDAMAGPTPVSALIHAATMVTAGVYMVSRMHPVFDNAFLFGEHGVPVLALVALVGALTAVFAASAACAQDDVKKVLAYSTVSQLGYMFLGAGVGAYGASIFHLVTHAFFKALLFLGAGALIHSCAGVQDLKKMGGLREKMPTTFRTMAIGAAALAGLPIFAGFFSKDMILGKSLERALGSGAPAGWWLVYLLGVVGGLMTAFYSTRLVVLAFYGKKGEASEHAHEAPSLMTGPLVALAGLATLGGLLGLPEFLGNAGNALPRFLGPLLSAAHHGEGEAHAGPEVVAMVVSFVAAALGAFVGWTAYTAEPLSASLAELEAGKGPRAPLRAFLAKAWRIDEAYTRFVAEPIMRGASKLWELVDDRLLDRGLVDGAGRLARGFGELMVELQTGRVARYAAYMAAGVVALLVYTMWWTAGGPR